MVPITVWRWTLLAAGAWIVACIPCVLLSERHVIPVDQSVFHRSQLAAALVAVVAAVGHLLRTVRACAGEEAFDEPQWARVVAWIAAGGATLVAALWVFAIVAGTIAMRDFD